ncbi:MAG: GxxExxY protein [Treponemataceae bacterium]
MDLEYIASRIVHSAICVHSALGPGLLESAYEACLARELELAGLECVRQKKLPIKYRGILIEAGYRIDLLVCESIIVELKTVDSLHPVHYAQLLSYLKLSDARIGFLLNFNVTQMKNGIKRLVNGL